MVSGGFPLCLSKVFASTFAGRPYPTVNYLSQFAKLNHFHSMYLKVCTYFSRRSPRNTYDVYLCWKPPSSLSCPRLFSFTFSQVLVSTGLDHAATSHYLQRSGRCPRSKSSNVNRSETPVSHTIPPQPSATFNNIVHENNKDKRAEYIPLPNTYCGKKLRRSAVGRSKDELFWYIPFTQDLPDLRPEDSVKGIFPDQ